MLPFDTLIIIDKSITLPVYKQVANQLVQHIRDGVLNSGTLLPGTRVMAATLKLHRKTVIAAYDELNAQGWITVIPRKGFMVAQNLPEFRPRKWDERTAGYSYNSTMPVPFYQSHLPAAPSLTTSHSFDLIIDDGHPDPRLAPLQLLNREYQSRLKQPQAFRRISSLMSQGSPKLREAMVNYIADTRGIKMQPEHIIITDGAQMSIYIAASLLLKPGDHVLVGEPGYYLANQVFEQLGAHIIRVPVDENGLDADAVADACRKYKISMLYLIPHHHHPTTVTLSPERRMRLLQMAEAFNFIIVEDDYDYDFHYTSSPYLPLAAGNHHSRVVYIGSFSKSLTTSIRIGFMIAAADFIRQAVHLRRLINLKGNYIQEDALAALILNGDIGRHLKKANKLYLERRDHLCTQLDLHLNDVVQYQKPSGGMAVWTVFNKAYPLKMIAQKAAKRGLYINNGNLFDTPENSYNAMRFGFASLSLTEISEAVLILANCI